MSAADDMIEDMLARDLAFVESTPRMRGPLEQRYLERLALDMAYFETFGRDAPWADETEAMLARRPAQPWVRPAARGEVPPTTVIHTLIDFEEPA